MVIRRGAAGIVAVTLLAMPALAAQPISGGSYSGDSSQGEYVSFAVSKNGNRVKSFNSELRGTCSDVPSFSDGRGFQFRVGQDETPFPVRIRDTGRFRGGGEVDKSDSAFVEDKFVVRGRFRKHGRIAKGHMSFSGETSEGVTCTTPDVGFKLTGF